MSPLSVPLAPTEPEESFGLACWHGEVQAMPAFHRHREVELNLVLSGQLEYLLGGRRVTVQAGRLALLWAAAPHRLMSAAGGTRMFWLTLPLEQVLAWTLPGDLLRAALAGHAVMDAAPDPADPARFESWAQLLGQPTTAGARRIVLLELEARLLRLARRWTADHRAGEQPVTTPGSGALEAPLVTASGAARHAELMTSFIASHYQRPIRVADVAAAAGLHPAYASALFKRAFGQSVVAHVTQYRVTHAQRLLITTASSILDVMYDAGFGSSSRFHEAFVRACGVSPRRFRLRGQR